MADQIDSGPEILSYVRRVSLRDDPVLRELREETAGLPMGKAMQISAEEGQLLALLVSTLGARTVLEVGTFTGYSTLCMARALPPGGRVITCDISAKWPDIGREYWRRAGVEDRISLRIGDAADTLGSLSPELGGEGIDLAFIDADKANYEKYYESVLELVRPGGLIVIDNTLFFGRVIDPDARDADTEAIRRLNEALHRDHRVEISLLPMADGITLVLKKPV